MSPTNLGNFLHFYTLKNRMTKRWAKSISLKKVKKLLRLKVLFVLQEKMDVGQFHFCPFFNRSQLFSIQPRAKNIISCQKEVDNI